MTRLKLSKWARARLRMLTANKFGAPLAAAALVFAVGCGGHSSTPAATNVVPPPTGSNVQAIAVNAGPAGNYANGAFTSVTVGTPGTTTCQTVDGILVDTGSSGLRILSSALTGVTLPQQTAADSNLWSSAFPL